MLSFIREISKRLWSLLKYLYNIHFFSIRVCACTIPALIFVGFPLCRYFLGFHINFEKSSKERSYTLEHPSYIWNTLGMWISLPSDKIIKTWKFAYPIHNIWLFLSRRNKLIFRFGHLLSNFLLHFGRIWLRYIDNLKQERL